ncbi:sulfite exporter TauE/SafE family protein [Arcobacter sp. CECT 8985]|uniref:sulfite exporter TauE/SafE family protein n=1 Tax=Arcobacter sp. CECT 8985 TaxID=1935424 RepID=UPI00100AEB58|nr:sulfite exporter TauE/SafE family protein [Arcobacter sp. CECT 8985]RXJ84250.1 beta-carotene 15,15'-monooxygenase [Arcobacter sp. CECT 8985]
METISIVSIIAIAFLGSFGHCIGMCGGIVVAYSSTKVKSGWSKQLQAISHVLYSLGRVTTYVILGFIFGFLGSVVTFNKTTSGILLIVIGILMVLIGLSLSGKIKFLTNLEHSVSKSPLYQRTFKVLISSNSLMSFYLLGMLNGLLPCGFVYVFAITAASTGSALLGGFVMLLFGLSTLPAMFSLGFFISIFKQTSLRNIMIKIAALVVIAFGIYIAYRGYKFMFDPSMSALGAHI